MTDAFMESKVGSRIRLRLLRTVKVICLYHPTALAQSFKQGLLQLDEEMKEANPEYVKLIEKNAVWLTNAFID